MNGEMRSKVYFTPKELAQAAGENSLIGEVLAIFGAKHYRIHAIEHKVLLPNDELISPFPPTRCRQALTFVFEPQPQTTSELAEQYELGPEETRPAEEDDPRYPLESITHGDEDLVEAWKYSPDEKY